MGLISRIFRSAYPALPPSPEPEPYVYDYTVEPWIRDDQIMVYAWIYPKDGERPEKYNWALPYRIEELNADPDQIIRVLDQAARNRARDAAKNVPGALNDWLETHGKPRLDQPNT